MKKVMKRVAILFVLFLAIIALETEASPMSEAQANNCIFNPIIVGETTVEEAKCKLKRKDIKHLNTFKIRQTQFDTYHYRSSRFRMTSLVFKDGVLIQIHEAGSS